MLLPPFSYNYYEESISWLHFCLLHLCIWYIPCNYIFRKSNEVYLSVFRIRQQSYHRLDGLETTGIYFSVLEAGNQRSGCRRSDSREGPSLACRLLTSHWVWRTEKGSELSHDSPKGTSPTHEGVTLVTSSNPSYLLRLHQQIPPHWWIGFQYMSLVHSVCIKDFWAWKYSYTG